MSYILVCSPSGTGVNGAFAKLGQYFSSGGLKIVDIERVLCNSWQAKDELRRAGVPSESPSMLDITWYLSRFKIAELWEIAAKQCMSDIATSRESTKIVCCNFMYYGGRRDEFYSVANSQIFSSNKDALRPSHIAVLIDDVYDMYLRLTGPGEIFDVRAWTREYLRRIENEEGIRIRALGQKQLSSYFLEAQLAIMNRLLTWRNTETIVAENLAFQLRAKFMAWGVKQLSEVIASWLKNPSPVSVYLSHPIARPRHKWREENTWPEVVAQFNSLQEALFTKHLICVMPTAIDELRIVKNGKRRQTLLEERWPLPTENRDDVLYCNPEGTTGIDHPKLIAPSYWNFKKQELVSISHVRKSARQGIHSDTLLRAFEWEIEHQTAARDHLLVSHTAGLLVFRPFIWQGEFSSGVEAEIVHWEFLAKTDDTKRAVFIHFDEDVKTWFDSYKREIRSGIPDWMATIVETKFNIAIDTAKKAVDWVRKRKGGMLDKGPMSREAMQQIAETISDIKTQAKISLLQAKLTGEMGVPKRQTGVWVVTDMEDLKRNYDEIAGFLKHGSAPGNNWHNRIDSLMPDDSQQ